MIRTMTTQDYIKLPYNIVMRHISDESGDYFFAFVQEFEGCVSDGETLENAYANILEAMEGWIETKLDGGFKIPEPAGQIKEYSGKFLVRIPKDLHRKLIIEAERQGVSLNQYALYMLASGRPYANIDCRS
jgi:predicted RNase H-like HicB family nuclease